MSWIPPTDAGPGGPPTFPPGWYREGPHLRWWDGAQWGPYAPAGPTGPPQTDEQRGSTIATVSHLGFLAGGFILPLVLYLIEKGKPDRNRYVMHHTTEALNYQITIMIGMAVGMAMFIGGAFLSVGTGEAGFPVLSLVGWLLFPALMIASYVFCILGAVRASKQDWWRYPVSIRFVGRGIDWQRV